MPKAGGVMVEHPNQPREYDAVLGGNTPSPIGAVVLGGIQGVKMRASNPVVKVRIAALTEALKYGQEGLNLLFQALDDSSVQVQQTAFLLLKERTEPSVQQRLRELLLISDAGVNYLRLRQLLADGNWKEADEETAQIILQVTDVEDFCMWGGEILHSYSILPFEVLPYRDLYIIDQLWQKYSNGNFGFSVQKTLWQDAGENVKNWCDRTGWDVESLRRNRNIEKAVNFSLNTPQGHLPATILRLSLSLEWNYLWLFVKSLMLRLESCSGNLVGAGSSTKPKI